MKRQQQRMGLSQLLDVPQLLNASYRGESLRLLQVYTRVRKGAVHTTTDGQPATVWPWGALESLHWAVSGDPVVSG